MLFDLRSSKIWILLVAGIFAFEILSLTPLWSRVQQHVPTFITSITPQKPTSNKSSIPQLPTEYTKLSPNEQSCEDTFGTFYLTKLAARQLPYCDAASSSRLQCFRTNRTDSMWESDSLCIAQGVNFNSSSDNVFGLQCKLRNFTREAEAGNKEAEGVQDISSMHSYWFDTGVHDTLASWNIQQDPKSTCNKQTADKTWLLLARREGNVNIFHKLAELWQASLSMDVARMAIDPSTNSRYLSAENDFSAQVVFDDDRKEPLDDWWTIVTGQPPIRQSQLEPGCYGNIIIPLAGSSSPFWTLLMQSAANPEQLCHNRALIDTFRHRIFRYLNIDPRPHTKRDPVITIIDRKKTRKIYNIDEYTSNLKQRYPALTINLIDFASISLLEQVQLIQNTDILIGHHGAGMAHVLFLPEQSSVIEIFPPVFTPVGFAQLSKMRGLTHFGANSVWIGDWLKEMNTTSEDGVEPEPFEESTWQGQEWVYVREKDFLGLVEAALRGQGYAGV